MASRKRIFYLEDKMKKSLSIQLPDPLANALGGYVKSGIFHSESEVILAATSEFIRKNRIDLMERFAREDIKWALREAVEKK